MSHPIAITGTSRAPITDSTSVCLGLVLAVLGCAGGCGSPSTGATAPPGSSDRATGQRSDAPVLLPVASDPTVSYCIWFQVGSQDDPVGKEGLAWLTGTLLEEGATRRMSYPEITAALFPMAASYRVRVDREMTTLRGRVHRDHIARFEELLTAAYLEPAFAPADFDRLRDRGVNALEKILRYASDEELGKAALQGAIFAGTRYAHPVNGTVAGLRAITLDDVKSFYRTYYTRDRVVFGVGGGYDPATVSRLEATRRSLPAGGAPRVAPPEPARLRGRHVLLVSKPDADASISIGFPISVQRGEADFYALWIAASWLGEHRDSSGHLYQVLREARGLNYGDYAYIERFAEGGRHQMPPTNVAQHRQMFEIWIRTLPDEHAVFALRSAVRELRRLVTNGMTQEQFDLTRSFLSNYILHFAPDTATRLGYAIDDRFYGIAGGHLDTARRAFARLTLAEVNRAIEEHLQHRDLQIAIVTGSADALSTALSGGAPSSIEYPVAKPEAVLAEDEEIATEPLDIPADRIRIVGVDEMFAR